MNVSNFFNLVFSYLKRHNEDLDKQIIWTTLKKLIIETSFSEKKK